MPSPEGIYLLIAARDLIALLAVASVEEVAAQLVP